MRARSFLRSVALVASVAVAQPAPDAGLSVDAAGPTILQLPTNIAAPKVSAAASPTIVELGAPFTVFITATYGPGVEVNLREPVELGGSFEVRRKLSEDTRQNGGMTTREWQLEVLPWETGDLVMPGIAVTYTVFGKADQIASNAINLRILGVLGDAVDDPKALRGVHPPVPLVVRSWFWLWVGIAVAGALAVLATALVVRRRRRRRRTQLSGGSRSMPRRIDMTSTRALEQLLAIEASGVLDQRETRKRGYLELADVVRDYAGLRYRVAVAELTSSELLEALSAVAPASELAMAAAFFETSDLVRYGGFRATTAQAQRALADARELVIATSSRDLEGAA